MGPYDFLIWAPLITAGTWLALSAYLVYGERYRTWTELFFLGVCVLVGAYGIADSWFFSQPGPPVDPTLEASVSLACITTASTFLALYGIALHGGFRRMLLLFFVPTAFFAFAFPRFMFVGFAPLPGVVAPRVPVYDPVWFLAWAVWLSVLWAAGLGEVTRTYFEVRRLNPQIGRRIAGILLGFVAALAIGGSSNGWLGLQESTTSPPLFSAFLTIPGLLLFFATTPTAYRRLNDAILRRKAPSFDVKAAFLTFSDGTLIGSKIQPEETMIDADAFSATLDVIQNFMRTSFASLRGKWLQSIRHGDYTLLLERGRHVYLTLVIGGQENDQLRRVILEGLRDFEQQNAAALGNWRGVAADATGVDALLDAMLAA